MQICPSFDSPDEGMSSFLYHASGTDSVSSQQGYETVACQDGKKKSAIGTATLGFEWKLKCLILILIALLLATWVILLEQRNDMKAIAKHLEELRTRSIEPQAKESLRLCLGFHY